VKKLLSLVLLLGLFSNSYSEEMEDDVSFGIGLGIPYGVFGANVNYAASENVDLTAGGGFGFGAGLRYRPFGREDGIRVTAFYGTNSMLANPTTNETEKFSGMNIGVGYGPFSNGWDVDVMYIMIPASMKDRIKELESQGYVVSGDRDNQIGFSFGYHW